MQHIYNSNLNAMKLALPDASEEQEQIANILFAQVSEIEQAERHLQKMRLMKSGLMQDLLTGNVRVKVDGGDQNAIED